MATRCGVPKTRSLLPASKIPTCMLVSVRSKSKTATRGGGRCDGGGNAGDTEAWLAAAGSTATSDRPSSASSSRRPGNPGAAVGAAVAATVASFTARLPALASPTAAECADSCSPHTLHHDASGPFGRFAVKHKQHPGRGCGRGCGRGVPEELGLPRTGNVPVSISPFCKATSHRAISLGHLTVLCARASNCTLSTIL